MKLFWQKMSEQGLRLTRLVRQVRRQVEEDIVPEAGVYGVERKPERRNPDCDLQRQG